MTQLDLIAAIELAYDRSTDDALWLSNLTAAIAPSFKEGLATTAFFFDLDEGAARVGRFVSVGEAEYTRHHYQQQHEVGSAASGRPQRVAYDCDMFTLLSRVVGAEVAAKSIRAVGMVGDDALGLRANATSESGIIFTTHVKRGYRIRQRALWTRFASHVGAALRLRRGATPPTPDTACAVLSRGRLEHGDTATIAARDDLANAAKDMERARGRLRRLDPDAATALWRAMVGGEWSLVDWMDHDGKRLLLVQENRVAVAGRKALSDRERQVVACAAMGHSNKLIAYDLGLSTGTVSVVLTRAAKKLGVSGRVALIRAFREQAG